MGDGGGEEGVEILEKVGEVWQYRENVFQNIVLSQSQGDVLMRAGERG